jgi:hypothetical protein
MTKHCLQMDFLRAIRSLCGFSRLDSKIVVVQYICAGNENSFAIATLLILSTPQKEGEI